MKKLKPGKTNQEDRNNFIDYWAEIVRTSSDEYWSRQQNVLIDSQIQNARRAKFLTVKEYLELKGEKCSRVFFKKETS